MFVSYTNTPKFLLTYSFPRKEEGFKQELQDCFFICLFSSLKSVKVKRFIYPGINLFRLEKAQCLVHINHIFKLVIINLFFTVSFFSINKGTLVWQKLYYDYQSSK